jgi:tetratricopeptide (TPR) repeat protein
LANFLRSLRSSPFEEAFAKSYGQTTAEFEHAVHKKLSGEKWTLAKGALSDEVRFSPMDENEAVGADAQAEMRLGDQMRMRNHPEAALIQYEKALEQEPDNAVLLLKAARVSLLLGQAKMARDYLEKAVEKNPNYVTPYIDLAALVEPARAKKLLLEAAAINPFDPRVR